MDSLIIVLLITLFLYLVIRDIVIAKKRRSNRILLKRISTKFDKLSEETKKQSRLFGKLLDILAEKEE